MARTNVPIVLLLTVLITALTLQTAQAESRFQEELRAGLESIYVFRTVRTQHHHGSVELCASAPFRAADSDVYALWSIGLRASDSEVVDTHERAVGSFTACFGPLTRDRPLIMYAVGDIAHIPWTGVGQCLVTRAQPSVKTLVAFSCRLTLGQLPAGYAGGLAVSSTVAPFISKTQGPSAHVRGYLSTSVVVVRLWRRPPPAAQPTHAGPPGTR
jgi:hypothetical protein